MTLPTTASLSLQPDGAGPRRADEPATAAARDDVAVLIPAYQPDRKLLGVLAGLRDRGFQRIFVVNDGSTKPASVEVFDRIREDGTATVLEHAVNLGQGAAVKTGLNRLHALHDAALSGVVTMDADGQHSPDDAVAIAEALRRDPRTLLIGGRTFDAKVPLRSRFGNVLTALIGRAFLRLTVDDTQSGMRGIPLRHVPTIVAVPHDRFDFAIGLLIHCRRARVPVRELPIQTIYIENNASSHFNPLLDSMKIYFVLARYILASLVVAAVDYAVFLAAYSSAADVLVANYSGRVVAMFVQYFAARNYVFNSKASAARTFSKYVLLVAVSGFISSALISSITRWTGFGVVPAKVCAEILLYVFNFVVQKDLVFASGERQS